MNFFRMDGWVDGSIDGTISRIQREACYYLKKASAVAQTDRMGSLGSGDRKEGERGSGRERERGRAQEIVRSYKAVWCNA